MKALIQRVTAASVVVDGNPVGDIGRGLLVLLGVEREDDTQRADKLVHKLLNYRVFADAAGKMNCSVTDIGGELLVVSQFTLAADTHSGLRPSFSSAAAPELANSLYVYAVEKLRASGLNVATGIFAADMQVSLVNDGPVTFLLES